MTDPDADARRYHRRQFVLAVADFGLTVALLVAWLWSGAAAGLARTLAARLPPPAVVALLFLALGASSLVLAAPLDLLRGYILPRRAGLLDQSLGGWLADKAKALVLGGALGLGAVELIYGLLAWSPDWWWLWSAAGLAAASVVLTAAVPVWIVPLFYRLTPLQDPELRERLLALAARAGVLAAEVAVADFSRKGRTANAAVVGLGRTRRILVSDTLLSSFPPEEIEVVLAHELAHHARGHLRQALSLQGVLLLVVFAAAHAALALAGAPLGLTGMADPAGLPLLGLILTALGLLATPVAAAWSRRLEREADAAALDVTRAPGAFVAAMERLGRLNLAERRPNRLKELLFATHPSLEQRIARARAAAERLAGAA
ncbi:MAG TPA: M48 family metalloprotease [Methylomirabilota bacterium]|nr:M48 family metalloprotease [Methylomirabilota bacterium]